MRIAVVKNQSPVSQTIDLSNTFRYLSTMPTAGFQTVSWWVGRGLPRLNYCGQGYGDFNCAMIPCSAFSFSGDMVKLRLRMSLFVSDPRVHTFRWGVAIFRSDNSYIGWQPASALGLLGQGTITPEWNNRAISWQEFDLPVSVPAGMAFYIYLWRNSTSYGNVHITDNVTVTAEVSGSKLAFYNATPYIYQSGIWKPAAAKVYSGGWKNGG